MTNPRWTTVQPDGWHPWHVAVKVEVHDGRAACVAVRIEPATDPPVPLTRERLARFPSATVAATVADTTSPGALTRAAKTSAPLHDLRAVVSVEAVANVFNEAVAAGRHDPRQTVCEVLGVSPSTAHRYIKRAREAGLISTGGTQ